jgi:hypothetical protein
MATSPKSVRRLLKDKPTLKHLELGISTRAALLAEVRRLLPDDLAGHCSAAQLDGHLLTLHADSPAWATRLRYLSAQLRSLMRLNHPALTEIRIRVIVSRQPPAARKRRVQKSAEAAQIIHDSALSTSPGPLREALLRLSRALQP